MTVVLGAPTAAPQAERKERIQGLDLARAVAIIGMVFVNFKFVIATDTLQGPDWLWRLLGLLEGRAASLFVILAGIGTSLMAGKARASGDPGAIRAVRLLLLKRSLFLFAVGLAFWTVWPADIIHFYGVYIAFGTLLLTMPSRLLGWLALALAAVSAAMLLHWPDLFLTGGYGGYPPHSPNPYLTDLRDPTFWTPIGFFRDLVLDGFHPVFPWLTFFLIGMVVGRADLYSAPIRRRLFLGGLIAAITANTTSFILVYWVRRGSGVASASDLFGTSPAPATPLYILFASGVAVMIIIACLWCAERFATRVKPLVAMGQMAFTLYIGHIVAGLLPFYGMGFLRIHPTLRFAVVWSIGFCILATFVCWRWKLKYRHGPLEWLMRRFAGG